jgi:uncharacterized protein YjiS (DUF1127 family)
LEIETMQMMLEIRAALMWREVRRFSRRALAGLARVSQSHRLRRARLDLATMPDYLLKDIGISRSSIDAAVDGMMDRSLGRARYPQEHREEDRSIPRRPASP